MRSSRFSLQPLNVILGTVELILTSWDITFVHPPEDAAPSPEVIVFTSVHSGGSSEQKNEEKEEAAKGKWLQVKRSSVANMLDDMNNLRAAAKTMETHVRESLPSYRFHASTASLMYSGPRHAGFAETSFRECPHFP